MKKTIAFAILFVFSCAAFANDGKMVFLTVVQKPQSIRVKDAVVVIGTPRGRFVASFGNALYELQDRRGTVIESGFVPPPPLTSDVPDSLGRLFGGPVARDSVEFSFRVPFYDSAAVLKFYTVNKDDAGRTLRKTIKGAQLGAFDLQKAVK